MTEFEFAPEAARRIEKVVQNYPLSLDDCADLLEIVAPLAGALTAGGACRFLRQVVEAKCNGECIAVVKNTARDFERVEVEIHPFY